MRILVVEDDPNLKNQIKQSLEDSGYSVDSADRMVKKVISWEMQNLTMQLFLTLDYLR